MAMRIACVGGGPGGLFFSALAKMADPQREVTVFERNRAGDTFGFGVVFSDATLAGIDAADPTIHKALHDYSVHWDAIEVRLKGETLSCGGNGMAAIERTTLLRLLQERTQELGVDIRYESPVSPKELLDCGYDLIVGGDGANSAVREMLSDSFGPRVDIAAAKFIWFGTTFVYDGLTFIHEMDEHGVFAAHAYPYSEQASTFIVETDEDSWRSAGLDGFDIHQPPGPSDAKSKAYLEHLFERQLQGRPLLENNSRWGSFSTRRAQKWHAGAADGTPVVILGDAAHTAHFSVGSGTKMAMEDAVVLASSISEFSDMATALDNYESVRKPQVARIQNSARPSLSWWEHFGRSYRNMPPWQFAYHFLSRSLPDSKLRKRDALFVDSSHERWREEIGAEPLESPLSSGSLHVERRVVEIKVSGTGRALATSAGILPLVEIVPTSPVDGAWGIWITAPESEDRLPETNEAVVDALAAGAAVVAVSGGTSFTRRLLTEKFRLEHGAVTLLVESSDDDVAITAVLSGRADLVAQIPA